MRNGKYKIMRKERVGGRNPTEKKTNSQTSFSVTTKALWESTTETMIVVRSQILAVRVCLCAKNDCVRSPKIGYNLNIVSGMWWLLWRKATKTENKKKTLHIIIYSGTTTTDLLSTRLEVRLCFFTNFVSQWFKI